MERLTTRNSEGVATLKHPDQCERCGEPIYRLNDMGSGEPISRLAYYEDIQSKLDERFLGCIILGKIVGAFIEFYDQQERDEPLAECMLIVNDNVRKYEQWKEADAQGLLLRLPCKVGDILYEPTNRGIISTYEVTAIRIELFAIFIEWKIVDGFVYRNINGVESGEIGKTVFLTKSEAEQALQNWKVRCKNATD